MRLRRRYAEFLRRASALPSLPLVSSLHAAVVRRGIPASLAASLIQGYSACGDLASARALFDETPPTLSSRTALAGALSAHGRSAEALAVLDVPEAETDDMLGEVEEAERLVTRMQARPDRVIFAALLAACRVHGRVDVAQRVAGLMRRYGIA